MLYADYKVWCEQNQRQPLKDSVFGTCLSRMFERYRSTDGYFRYRGIDLKDGRQAGIAKRQRINRKDSESAKCNLCGNAVWRVQDGRKVCASCVPGDAKQSKFLITAVTEGVSGRGK